MISRGASALTPEQKAAVMRALARRASPVARLVARRLMDLDHGEGAWPGYHHLADYVGCSEGSARRALSDLERLGAVVSGRRPGLGNLRAYVVLPVEEWALAVTRNRDTESSSPETVTPKESLSPPASPAPSPSVSPETVRSIQQVGSPERENSRKDARSAGALGEQRPAGGDSSATPTNGSQVDLRAISGKLLQEMPTLMLHQHLEDARRAHNGSACAKLEAELRRRAA